MCAVTATVAVCTRPLHSEWHGWSAGGIACFLWATMYVLPAVSTLQLLPAATARVLPSAAFALYISAVPLVNCHALFSRQLNACECLLCTQATSEYIIERFVPFNPVDKKTLAEVITPDGRHVTYAKGAPQVRRKLAAAVALHRWCSTATCPDMRACSRCTQVSCYVVAATFMSASQAVGWVL